jgi:hypothetical protein
MELRIAIIVWIEREYHGQRRQAGLGRLTSVKCETMIKTIGRPGRVTKIFPKPASVPSDQLTYCTSN